MAWVLESLQVVILPVNEGFKEKNLFVDLIYISKHTFAVLSGRIKLYHY